MNKYPASRGTGKYHNTPVEDGGIRFDSKAEAARYAELLMLQKAGVISDLKHHPTYVIMDGYNKRDGTHVRPINYEGDYFYIENGQQVVEDVKSKGTITQVFQLKRKLFERQYPEIDFRLVGV